MTRIAALLLLVTLLSQAADLKPEAVRVYDRYTHDAEARLTPTRQPFLWADGAPDRVRELQRGQTLVQPHSGNGDTSAPGAMIHDWVGTVFIPGATIEKTLAVMQDYDHHKSVYHDVLDSKLLAHNGNDYKFLRIRQLKKAVISGVYRTEFEAHYQQVDARRWISTSRSTLIAEIENYGKPNQHELPPGHDAGYLWRLNGYWRLEQRDNGVYLECEAISLTRSLPALLSALFAPAMHGLESETMSNTLQQTRDAVRK
ncbi:MAG: hypothetical protein U0Q18_34720 [Bryobacteraceae bacterium]